MSVLLRQEKEDNKERLTLQLNELTKKISLLEERYMLKKLTRIRVSNPENSMGKALSFSSKLTLLWASAITMESKNCKI